MHGGGYGTTNEPDLRVGFEKAHLSCPVDREGIKSSQG